MLSNIMQVQASDRPSQNLVQDSMLSRAVGLMEWVRPHLNLAMASGPHKVAPDSLTLQDAPWVGRVVAYCSTRKLYKIITI